MKFSNLKFFKFQNHNNSICRRVTDLINQRGWMIAFGFGWTLRIWFSNKYCSDNPALFSLASSQIKSYSKILMIIKTSIARHTLISPPAGWTIVVGRVENIRIDKNKHHKNNIEKTERIGWNFTNSKNMFVAESLIHIANCSEYLFECQDLRVYESIFSFSIFSILLSSRMNFFYSYSWNNTMQMNFDYTVNEILRGDEQGGIKYFRITVFP